MEWTIIGISRFACNVSILEAPRPVARADAASRSGRRRPASLSTLYKRMLKTHVTVTGP